jgi:hypothetical protein
MIGLRTIGSKRIRCFDVGESSNAVRTAEAGDEITDDLVRNMSDEGLDRFAGALAVRGLEFGDVSTEHEGSTRWVLHPLGQPEFEAPELARRLQDLKP